MSSKHLDALLSFRHDTSSEGLYRLLLRPLLLELLLYRGHPPFPHSHGDVSILPIRPYSPFVCLGFVYPPFPPLTLLQRGSREGLPPLHCPANHHHGLAVKKAHPLYWWTLVCVLVPGRSPQEYVGIWPLFDLSSVDVDNVPNSHGL